MIKTFYNNAAATAITVNIINLYQFWFHFFVFQNRRTRNAFSPAQRSGRGHGSASIIRYSFIYQNPSIRRTSRPTRSRPSFVVLFSLKIF